MRDYQTKSNVGGVADSISATRFGGGEFNSIAVELENAVESSDQTLAPADGTGEVDNQLSMAMAIYGAGGAAFHLDTGAANAYVLDPVSPKESPPTYFDGFTVSFVPGNVNTGASTVNINSIGAVDLVSFSGDALTGGELQGPITIRYNSSAGEFRIIGSSTGQCVLRTYTASDTYTPNSAIKSIEIIAIGAGGGGGGVDGQGAGEGNSGSGGAGATVIKYQTKLDPSYTIVIGTGGSGGVGTGGNNGIAGGNTTVTSATLSISANGGAGGSGNIATISTLLASGGGGGGASGGDINIDGGDGGSGRVSNGNAIPIALSGSGIFGGAVLTIVTGAAGSNATVPGVGGGATYVGSVATDYNGGDGADGIVIIKEYY